MSLNSREGQPSSLSEFMQTFLYSLVRTERIPHFLFTPESPTDASQNCFSEEEEEAAARRKVEAFTCVSTSCQFDCYCQACNICLIDHYMINIGSRDSLLVIRWTRDRKVASSNPCRSGGRIFFLRVNIVRWFGVRSTPVLPQWHVKDPSHSTESARWQVTPKHAYNLDPAKSEWADYADVQA